MGGEEFIETLPPDLKAEARPFVFFDNEAVADSYLRLFDELYEAYKNTATHILLAPCWAHGASEAFLRRVRAKADERRRDDPYALAAVAGAEAAGAQSAAQRCSDRPGGRRSAGTASHGVSGRIELHINRPTEPWSRSMAR